jgi:hypothetical protein
MTPPRKRTAVTLTIKDTTMTTYAPAAAAGDWLTPAPEDQHPDGSEPRSAYVRSEPTPRGLGISGDPTAAWDDPPPHAARAGAGS